MAVKAKPALCGLCAIIGRMDTLALDYSTWDLTVDQYGNWATIGDATPQNPATGPGMRLAQDVATRCLAWYSEVYYDTTQGIKYPQIMGLYPNLTLLQASFNTQALLVPGCQTALANFTFTAGKVRNMGGSVAVSDMAGNAAVVTLT
jgi:hypothetical protein